ncbi:MAG: SGNH/GDSL hydrolase family protein [Candidatus Dadabacteria bacterium]|nr:MAG: SGNH/GDSL hydrolase family protein [Candidatus Dadabacteria bacterium]
MILNPWILGLALAPDGTIESASTKWLIALVQLTLIALGTLTIIRRPQITLPLAGPWTLLLASIPIGLLAAELAVRVLPGLDHLHTPPRAVVGEYANRPSLNFVPDSLTGWRMRPNHEFRWSTPEHDAWYRSNAQGFRSARDFASSVAGRRIALTGDSFTFGTGVELEQTFGALIEQMRPAYAVYNLAMPGYGIDQMWMSLRQALLLNPDLAIVAFVDQDFDRSLTAYRRTEGFNKPTFVLEDGELRPQQPSDRSSRLVWFLERHARVWNAWEFAIENLNRRMRRGDWWSVNSALFRAMDADARAAGVPLLFVRIPMATPTDFPALRLLMGKLDASYLDLGAPDSVPPYPIHFAEDGHINARGHRYVAQRVIAWLDRAFAPGDGR